MRKVYLLSITAVIFLGACGSAQVNPDAAVPVPAAVISPAISPVAKDPAVTATPVITAITKNSAEKEKKSPANVPARFVLAAPEGPVPEAVTRLLPGEGLKKAVLSLSADEIETIKAAIGGKITVRPQYEIYVLGSGAVVIEEQMGKWGVIKAAVLIDSASKKFRDLAIISMSEKRGAGIKNPNFIKQFAGKTAADKYEIGSGITAVSGATVSSRAVVITVKRALAVYGIFSSAAPSKADAPAGKEKLAAIAPAPPVMGKPGKTDGPVSSSPETLALIKAAEAGDDKTVSEQLAAGADINGKTMDNDQVTALMKAAERSQAKTVRLLLDAGADVNVISRFGFSALMFAADSGNKETVEALIAAGADVNKVGHMFATALGWSKNDVIREILRKAGAKQ